MPHLKVLSSSVDYELFCQVLTEEEDVNLLMKLMILKTFNSITMGLILDLEFLTLLTYILWPTGGVECRGQSMELQVVYFTTLLINCLKKETAKHNHFPGPILFVPRKKLKPILLNLGKHLLVV